jgi:hypothetical protein
LKQHFLAGFFPALFRGANPQQEMIETIIILGGLVAAMIYVARQKLNV